MYIIKYLPVASVWLRHAVFLSSLGHVLWNVPSLSHCSSALALWEKQIKTWKLICSKRCLFTLKHVSVFNSLCFSHDASFSDSCKALFVSTVQGIQIVLVNTESKELWELSLILKESHLVIRVISRFGGLLRSQGLDILYLHGLKWAKWPFCTIRWWINW